MTGGIISSQVKALLTKSLSVWLTIAISGEKYQLCLVKVMFLQQVKKLRLVYFHRNSDDEADMFLSVFKKLQIVCWLSKTFFEAAKYKRTSTSSDARLVSPQEPACWAKLCWKMERQQLVAISSQTHLAALIKKLVCTDMSGRKTIRKKRVRRRKEKSEWTK